MADGLPIVLCRAGDLPEGRSRGFDPRDRGCDELFIVRRCGRLHAWRNACPHVDGAPMALRRDEYVNVRADRIVCAAHGAHFEIDTGLCVLGPCLGQRLEAAAIDVDPEGIVRWLDAPEYCDAE